MRSESSSIRASARWDLLPNCAIRSDTGPTLPRPHPRLRRRVGAANGSALAAPSSLPHAHPLVGAPPKSAGCARHCPRERTVFGLSCPRPRNRISPSRGSFHASEAPPTLSPSHTDRPPPTRGGSGAGSPSPPPMNAPVGPGPPATTLPRNDDNDAHVGSIPRLRPPRSPACDTR